LYGSNVFYGTHLVELNEFGNPQDQPISGLFMDLEERFAFSPKIILQEDQKIYFITENSSKTKFRLIQMGLN